MATEKVGKKALPSVLRKEMCLEYSKAESTVTEKVGRLVARMERNWECLTANWKEIGLVQVTENQKAIHLGCPWDELMETPMVDLLGWPTERMT